MRKKILMIGNTDGLPGVLVDIDDCYAFFTSPIGGNWHCDEIDILMNPTKRNLSRKLSEIEYAAYDYVIVIFSGHGCEEYNGIVLAINEHEIFAMRHLTNLSPKQLMILDCCRSYRVIDEEDACINNEAIAFSRFDNMIRHEYERMIDNAVPQEIVLYSCDENEVSLISNEGSYYSQYLLTAAEIAMTQLHVPAKNVRRIHDAAVEMMRQDYPFSNQHPRILEPHRLVHRRLPFAINPNLW